MNKLRNCKNITNIKNEINKYYCLETEQKLSDENLKNKYVNTPSTQRRLKVASAIIQEVLGETVSTKQKKELLDKMTTPFLILPGTKGAVRGNIFNKMVKEKIISINLDNKRFDILFEPRDKKIWKNSTGQRPDWLIKDKKTGKIIIGMNQIDLWNGGAQKVRASEYLNHATNEENNIKILCIICRKPDDNVITNPEHDTHKIFKLGLSNKTLCYINGIRCILDDFFKSE